MHTLIFATNNAHKVQVIKAVLPQGISVISLREAGIMVDIPEPFDTLEANASEKSRVIFEITGQDCFSEDTGLEVEALGRPDETVCGLPVVDGGCRPCQPFHGLCETLHFGQKCAHGIIIHRPAPRRPVRLCKP